MGCASSAPLEECVVGFTATKVVDLALCCGATDDDARGLAPAVTKAAPTALTMPPWPRPTAPLSGVGFQALCRAAATTLRSVEIHEAALPKLTADAVASAVALLPVLEEVTLRGPVLPRQVLVKLGQGHAKPSVRTVVLAGAGVDGQALTALPVAFPCLTALTLGHLSPTVDWADVFAGLRFEGVRYEGLTSLRVLGRWSLRIEAAFATLCPALRLPEHRAAQQEQIETDSAPRLWTPNFSSQSSGPQRQPSQRTLPSKSSVAISAATDPLAPSTRCSSNYRRPVPRFSTTSAGNANDAKANHCPVHRHHTARCPGRRAAPPSVPPGQAAAASGSTPLHVNPLQGPVSIGGDLSGDVNAGAVVCDIVAPSKIVPGQPHPSPVPPPTTNVPVRSAIAELSINSRPDPVSKTSRTPSIGWTSLKRCAATASASNA